ncbi:glycosyltransferase [Subtercola boreus]|uniref:Glycosyltransferase subfamily 4-like N-terminal domain-containing protein n=1 Tax=Subtercola boreus TaxID=120213 RepID=A0A3E0WAQ9_9MICO|nr:glycosyltransferase [Subtercola boreus]RFA19028.1 hypothetical protein B7R24_12895 [Subtercola boreus]RFA19166.1 hypothetical protein B7R23_12875 [Subtercola boreus]RFA25628.1 hypothetical protein B7R25_12995 [Subtercola boreus]
MPDSAPAVSGPLRIAAVPAAHPYVQNLVDAGSGGTIHGVTLLTDPQPVGAAAGQWWPPVMLDPRWIARNADSFDVLHLHFGTESFSLGHLAEVVDALRSADRPLVFTVHDLTNPQLVDQAAHLAQLELLVNAADEVITLTEGAADQVRARWAREATVIAHPRLAALPAPAPTHAASLAGSGAPVQDAVGPSGAPVQDAALTIGVHLRDLRPNIDALGAIDTLLTAVGTLRESGFDLAVRVDLNDRVRDEAVRRELRTRLEGVGFVRLLEHPRFSDDELSAALLATDVSVMPYAHGTHSGWLELCWDLGVAVAAPDVGFYSEQHPVRGEVATYERGSADSLARTLLELLEPFTLAGAGARAARRAQLRLERAAFRIEQQRGIHAAHLAVYRRALAGVRV